MSGRAHLNRESIIDVNGHQKTVYRLPKKISYPRSNAVLATPPIHHKAGRETKEFAIANMVFSEVWAETNRAKWADDYIGQYKEWDGWNVRNTSGTLNAMTGDDDGIIFFVEPNSETLVLTAAPSEYDFATFGSAPVVEPIEGGYKISYVAEGDDGEDRTIVTFQSDLTGNYSSDVGIANIFKDNEAAESYMEEIRGQYPA